MSRFREKKCFVRNTNIGKNVSQPYVWCPDMSMDKQSGINIGKGGTIKPFCNATKYSQGYDNITGYMYELIVVNGMVEHLAYVECNYVQ